MRGIEPSSAAVLIVIGLLLFAAYQLHLLASLLIGGDVTVLLPIGVAVQGISALLAAIGISGVYGWATLALVVLGASALLTQLYEAFGLGIVPWMDALLKGIAAVIAVFLCILWLRWNRSCR